MTQPRAPQPIRRATAPAPRAVPVANNRSTDNTPAPSNVNVDPRTSARTVRPILRARRERMLLGGDTVAGKTYAWLRRCKQDYDRTIGTSQRMPTWFVLDTDDSMPSALGEGEEFEQLYYERGGPIRPYPAFTWDESAAAVGTILKEAQRGDWIVIDLSNRLYDQAQNKVAQIRGKSLVNEKIDRAIRKQGFGAFNSDDWGMVTQIFDNVIDQLMYQTEANLIFVSHITDVVNAKNRAEKREVMVLFDQLGMKTRGAPKLPGTVDTIVILWAVKRFMKDDGGRVVGSQIARHATTLKDRGREAYSDDIYGQDFFDVFYEARRRRNNHSTTILDPVEAAALTQEARDVIVAREADLTEGTTSTDDSSDDEDDEETSEEE